MCVDTNTHMQYVSKMSIYCFNLSSILYEISYLIRILICLLTRFAMTGRLIHEKNIQYIFIQVTVDKLEDIALLDARSLVIPKLFSNIVSPLFNLLKT